MTAQTPAAAAPPPSPKQHHAGLFAQAAETGSGIYRSLPDSIWLSRTSLTLQTAMLPFAIWFKPFVIIIAAVWLIYRAYQVLNKPLEELATLLGFDLPSTPLIDLASIKADGAIIHWSLPEKQKQKSTLKFEIHVNGTMIDTLSIHETAATITGLHPGCFYVVRISLVYNNELGSRSAAIRFRTKPVASGEFFVVTADSIDTEVDLSHEPIPRIRPFRGLKDVTPVLPVAEPMVREGSTGSGPRRSITGGRKLAASLGPDRSDQRVQEHEQSEAAETLQQLAEKLDHIQRETDDAEKQAKEEEEEEHHQKEELTRERDSLRAEATEKERASRNLKREVNTLERQNTAAQNERSKHEKILAQKKLDRQRAKDDIVRWAREADEMGLEVKQIYNTRLEHSEKVAKEKEDFRSRHASEIALVKSLDDEVKEKTVEIRKLDRAIKTSSPNGQEAEMSLVQQLQHDAEEKRAWEMHYTALQQQYASAVQKMEQSKRMYAEQATYLETLRARRRQEDAAHHSSPPSTQERLPRRGDSPRSRRAQSGHSSSDSPKLTNYLPVNTNAFGSGAPSSSSIFSPFMNQQHGMMLNGPTDQLTMSDEEKERMTGGAAVSPSAGADLLPTDLFVEQPRTAPSDPMQVLPGLGSLPGLPSLIGPVPQPVHDQSAQGPVSPASSRSASVFASPQASQQNLHLGSPENMIDADRRSIRSNRSGRAPSGGGAGSRFSGMFGIKQRSKNAAADEGLGLGKTHSHSMPRQDQGILVDMATRKRNSSISAMSLGNPLHSDAAIDGSSDDPPATRRRGFNLFGKDKGDAWPSNFTAFGRRPVSPRPDSTHSNDLPRPSFDSSRWGVDAWPSVDSSSGARSSPLAFGPGWNAPSASQSRIFGSRLPSRRPSAQPEDILEDDDSDVLGADQEAHLAPIGTKPAAGSKKAEKQLVGEAAKLNPNAKDFKSLFSGIKLRDRDKGSPSSQPNTPNPGRIETEDSQDIRDTPSVTGTESSIAESGRTSSELNLTASFSHTDVNPAPSPGVPGGSSAGKESFMQKLSRKSSSSKFTLPTFKRDKSRLDANASTPTSAPAEDEEEDMSVSVGSLKESSTPRESKEVARGGGRNWSNVLKLGKKKGNETPSLSGVSMTSGTTEDDEEAEEDEE